jgi:hypothetical protein
MATEWTTFAVPLTPDPSPTFRGEGRRLRVFLFSPTCWDARLRRFAKGEGVRG